MLRISPTVNPQRMIKSRRVSCIKSQVKAQVKFFLVLVILLLLFLFRCQNDVPGIQVYKVLGLKRCSRPFARVIPTLVHSWVRGSEHFKVSTSFPQRF